MELRWERCDSDTLGHSDSARGLLRLWGRRGPCSPVETTNAPGTGELSWERLRVPTPAPPPRNAAVRVPAGAGNGETHRALGSLLLALSGDLDRELPAVPSDADGAGLWSGHARQQQISPLPAGSQSPPSTR